MPVVAWKFSAESELKANTAGLDRLSRCNMHRPGMLFSLLRLWKLCTSSAVRHDYLQADRREGKIFVSQQDLVGTSVPIPDVSLCV